MAVNWNMAVGPDVGTNIYNAFQQGQQQGFQERGRNALTAYAQNPNEQTLGALAQYDPKFVMEQKAKQAEKAQQKQERKLIGDALSHPDPKLRAQARSQLAYTNSDLYMKLDESGKKAVDAAMKPIGQLAFSILQLPEAQQGAALDQAIAGLQAQGWDTSGFQRTGNARQDLMTALAVTGQLDKWETFSQPKYAPVGEGGLVGFQFGAPIQQGGQTQNFAPQQSGPAVGSVYGGYRFKGGNPNDRNSWEPVGGQPGGNGPFGQ